jgi:hypothetical protein
MTRVGRSIGAVLGCTSVSAMKEVLIPLLVDGSDFAGTAGGMSAGGLLIPKSASRFPLTSKGLGRLYRRFVPLLLLCQQQWPSFAAALLLQLALRIVHVGKENSVGQRREKSHSAQPGTPTSNQSVSNMLSPAQSERRLFFLHAWSELLLSRGWHWHALSLCSPSSSNFASAPPSIAWADDAAEWMGRPAASSLQRRLGYPFDELIRVCLRTPHAHAQQLVQMMLPMMARQAGAGGKVKAIGRETDAYATDDRVYSIYATDDREAASAVAVFVRKAARATRPQSKAHGQSYGSSKKKHSAQRGSGQKVRVARKGTKKKVHGVSLLDLEEFGKSPAKAEETDEEEQEEQEQEQEGSGNEGGAITGEDDDDDAFSVSMLSLAQMENAMVQLQGVDTNGESNGDGDSSESIPSSVKADQCFMPEVGAADAANITGSGHGVELGVAAAAPQRQSTAQVVQSMEAAQAPVVRWQKCSQWGACPLGTLPLDRQWHQFQDQQHQQHQHQHQHQQQGADLVPPTVSWGWGGGGLNSLELPQLLDTPEGGHLMEPMVEANQGMDSGGFDGAYAGMQDTAGMRYGFGAMDAVVGKAVDENSMAGSLSEGPGIPASGGMPKKRRSSGGISSMAMKAMASKIGFL